MRKIKLFTACSSMALQQDINRWLAEHKNAEILDMNLTSLAKVNVLSSDASTEGEYTFYILYSGTEDGMEEHMLAEMKQIPSELTDPGIIESEIN